MSHWLRYADATKAVVEKKTWASETDKVNGMVQENVIAQLNNIKTHPSVAVGLRDHTLRLHGWFYDIETGDIQALDKKTQILCFRWRMRTFSPNKVFPGHGGPANPHHATQILQMGAALQTAEGLRLIRGDRPLRFTPTSRR